MPFYAVRRGKVPGIYESWGECQEQILKFPGARYKKFATKSLAQSFLDGEDNPAEAAMSSGDWSGACKQKLLELVATLTSAATDLNKYLGTLPESLNTNDAVLAGFNDAKANVSACKKSIEHLIDKLDGQPVSASSNSKAGSKRKAADKNSSDPSPSKVNKSEDSSEWTVVYTDGACFNNGKANPCGGIGVWFGHGDERNLSMKLSGRQTNNRAEIHAACEAIEIAKRHGCKKLEIRTDSNFMITSMTDYIHGWKKRDWKLSTGGPVKNKEDFQRLDGLIDGIDVKWTHVRGHCGIEGNEAADRLANAGARLSS